VSKATLDYALEDDPETVKRNKRLREGVRFDMRGGPWDGCMLRLWPTEWDVWDVTEFNGSYIRPKAVDPHMVKAKPNKKRDNVPYVKWKANG